MKENETINEPTQLDFALAKFFGLKYPIYVGQRLYLPEHSGILHNHDYPQIWYCVSGSYHHYVNGEVFECQKGSVVIIPPGTFHKFRIPAGGETILLDFSVGYDVLLDQPTEKYINTTANLFLRAFSKELNYTPQTYMMLSPESQAAFEEYVSWFALLPYNHPSIISIDEILKHLECLFTLQEFALPKKYHPRVVQLAQSHLAPIVRAIIYLNTYYRERIKEDALLKTLGISRSSLYRYFKRFTGYAHTHYLQLLRVMHVDLYLMHTSYPLTYISDMCGFYDAQHMSNVFKKYRNRTPREHRIKRYMLIEQYPEKKLHIK